MCKDLGRSSPGGNPTPGGLLGLADLQVSFTGIASFDRIESELELGNAGFYQG